MFVGDTLNQIMSQNSSNPTGNNSMTASYAQNIGSRALTSSEMESLRRMTTMQQQQQQQQQQNNNQPQTIQSSQQMASNPFVVLAQVPVQGTPFANNFTHHGQGQTANGSQSSNHGGVQQQQHQPNLSFSTTEESWAQMLQPTPLAPDHSHTAQSNKPQQLQPNHQSSHASRSGGQALQYSNAGTNNQNNNSSNMSNNRQFNATTMSFLQELMRNAAQAALQQQQQQTMQGSNQNANSNNNNSMSGNPMRSNNMNAGNNQNASNTAAMMHSAQAFLQSMGGGPANNMAAGVMPVDSSVSPVTRPDSSNNSISSQPQGVDAWKQMWDSASQSMFQQQHQQLLHKAATSQDSKFPSNAAALPVQPAKRKFTDMSESDNPSPNKRGSRTFHPIDSFGSVDLDDDNAGEDNYLDFDPTPLSEIRERERNEAIEAERQLQSGGTSSVGSSNSAAAMPNFAQWQQTWNTQAQQQQQANAPAPPPQFAKQQLPTRPGIHLETLQANVAEPPVKKQPDGLRQPAFILPSTMMPPTVLASTFTEQSATTNRKKRPGAKSARSETPHDALQRIVRERGYGTNIRFTSDEAGYDAVPSPLQLASFGTEVVKAVHTSNPKRLGELLSTGLSPNPCNQFRDSIVDLVCKRANEDIFQCLVEHGSELRVCDGFGRTPLHHCCWASEFSPDIAHSILKTDLLQLFIEDKRGQTPLEYVRPSLADSWVEFLEEHKDEFFPFGGSIPMLMNVKDNRPDGSLPDPLNSLPVQLAAAVSSGQVTPEQVATMDDDARADYVQQYSS